MLDVHPPHHATHTWRDFFIHIATIVVGLLIAVGLEQTVEALHHRHQRHELEANLRIDGELNQQWANQDLDAMTKLRDWAQRQSVVVEHGSSSGPLPLPAVALGHVSTPNFGVFLAARANGQMSLLPSWQQNMQADLDRNVNQIFISDYSDYRRLKNALGDLNQLILGHSTRYAGESLDLGLLNAAQRVELGQRLSAIAESARQMEDALVRYAAENALLLENPDSPAKGEFDKKFERLLSHIAATHQDTSYSFTLR